MRPKTIIAIGGGEIGRLLPDGSRAPLSTLPIEREIVARAGKARPRLLFVPTASDDSAGYRETVEAHFGGRLGCEVETLELLSDPPDRIGMEARVRRADIVYVGGGNTLRMLTVWRRTGLDALLREAHDRGTVMCGVSAGAICWFRHGNSDSRKFTSGSDKLIRVTGLGMAEALLCPHYDTEPLRRSDLPRMMRRTPGVALALDDLAAMEISDGTCRVLSADGRAGVRRGFRRAGEFVLEEVPARESGIPLASLLDPRERI